MHSLIRAFAGSMGRLCIQGYLLSQRLNAWIISMCSLPCASTGCTRQRIGYVMRLHNYIDFAYLKNVVTSINIIGQMTLPGILPCDMRTTNLHPVVQINR